MKLFGINLNLKKSATRDGLESSVPPEILKDMVIPKPEEVPVASVSGQTYAEPETYQLSYSNIQKYYINNTWVRKYINTIVRTCLEYKLKAVPTETAEDIGLATKHAEEINTLLKYSSSYETFTAVRQKYLRDLLLFGNGGIEISPRDSTTETKALYAAPGYLLRVNCDDKGNLVPEKAYKFLDVNTGTVNETITFPFTSMIHLKYDELSDRIYGISPIQAVSGEIQADTKASVDMTRSDYGVPVQIIKFPKQARTYVDKVIDMIQQVLSGKGGNRIVGVNVEATTIPLSDKKFSDELEYQKTLLTRHNIFSIPPFKLGMPDIGSTGAKEQREEFQSLIETIVQYECDMLTLILVRARMKYTDVEIIVPGLITRLDFDKTRVVERLVNAGVITPNEGRVIFLGLSKSPEAEADKLRQPKGTPTETPAVE